MQKSVNSGYTNEELLSLTLSLQLERLLLILSHVLCRLTGLWFLPKPAFGLNTNNDDDSVFVCTVIRCV